MKRPESLEALKQEFADIDKKSLEQAKRSLGQPKTTVFDDLSEHGRPLLKYFNNNHGNPFDASVGIHPNCYERVILNYYANIFSIATDQSTVDDPKSYWGYISKNSQECFYHSLLVARCYLRIHGHNPVLFTSDDTDPQLLNTAY